MSSECDVRAVLDDHLSAEIPMLEVFIDTITDTRNISKVIPSLNNTFPVSKLAHLKRVKGKDILLFPCGNLKEEDVHEILSEKGFNTSYLKDDVRRLDVAAFPPLVKHQYLKCHAKWPCNFHADKYLEKLYTNTLFDDEELKKISVFMSMADEVGKFSKSMKNSGVVVIDPEIQSVVAIGYDKSEDGPCRHGVMVAVDNVAKTQNGGAWKKPGDDNKRKSSKLHGIPEEVLSQLKMNHQGISFGSSEKADSGGPYLCTGYEVYTTTEPCIMCAMALVHSRCKRLFYKLPIEHGGLGSSCKIHTVKDLNHHYEVFKVEIKTS